MEKLNVIIKKIKYCDEKNKLYIFDGLTSLKKKTPSGKTRKVKTKVTFKGNFMSIYIEDDINVVGYWIDNEKYGRQFIVVSYEKNIPQTIKGIQTFLKQIVRGIGEKRAEAITNAYGEDSLNIIAKNINALDIIPGITKDQKEEIWLAIAQNIEFEKLLAFMQLNDLDYTLAIKIYNRFKEDSIIRIKDNPYVLYMENIVPFSVCDQIACNLNVTANSLTRLVAALYSFIQGDVTSNGNLYTTVSFIYKKFNKYLEKKGRFADSYEFSEEEIEKGLKYLEKDERVVFCENKKGRILYLKNNLYIENKIVELISRKMNSSIHRYGYPEKEIENFLEGYEKSSGIKMAPEQKEAVISALKNTISIITGGPGTGKTKTMAAIIHCIKTLSPDATIHLCSPTGKAAKRMNEMSGMDASTIHRLVKIFNANDRIESNIISGDFIIIDEASMIDAYVFYRLLSSLDEDIRIVIIGDYNQLPSVGAGLILRDLIDSNTIKTTSLKEIFRQAKNSKIVTNSNIIINTGLTAGVTLSRKCSGDFFFIEESSTHEIQRKIIMVMKKLMTNMKVPLSDIQVLSAVKGTSLGTEALNRLIQNEFNNNTDFIESGEMQFNSKDKVIHIVNNYDLNVFNGETGVIGTLNYNESNMLTIDYPDKSIDYPAWSLEELELAYAITVHKSQGSEFPIVIMPIHSIVSRGLYRNLIYTAITRAKSKMIFIGDKEVFKETVLLVKGNIRNSMVKEKLIKEFE